MGSKGRVASRGVGGHMRLRAAGLALVLGALSTVPVVAGPAAPGEGVGPAALARPWFEVLSDGATVELRWAVAAGDAVGFHILRAVRSSGPYVPVNPWLVPADGRAEYRFADLAVAPGATYFYRIERVDAHGPNRNLGPLAISVMPSERTLLASGPEEGAAGEGGGAPALDQTPRRAVLGPSAPGDPPWGAAGLLLPIVAGLLLGGWLLWVLRRGRGRRA